MSKKYYIGELEFNTKKKCEDYTRNIISELGCGIINKDNHQFIFFDNLIKNHPNYDSKKGKGIDYFYIQRNSMVNNYYEMGIKRIDDSETDFSWIRCCKFKNRNTRDDLVIAMRTAIKDDTISYKKKSKLICNYCKSENECYENYHVDHHNPSFQVLKDNFLQLTKKTMPLTFDDSFVFNNKKYNTCAFKDEDNDFKNDWIDYHNNNCNFQILCSNCNLTKDKT
jgi:hypothetical protein